MFEKLKQTFYQFNFKSLPIDYHKQKYNNFIFVIKDGDLFTEIEETNILKLEKLRIKFNATIISNFIKKYISKRLLIRKKQNEYFKLQKQQKIRKKQKRNKRRRRRKKKC